MVTITNAYAGSIRNQPLDPRLVEILTAAADLAGIDELVVVSAGQPTAAEDPTGAHRTGSTRHDHGGAADFDVKKDGRLLDMRNPDDLPVFSAFVTACVQMGAMGIGGAPGVAGGPDYYMGPSRLHVGFGTPAHWGSNHTPRTSPPWLVEAWNAAFLTPAECRRLQSMLRDRGYVEVGAIDGDWGSKTLGALNRFRSDNGLPHYGDLSHAIVTQADWAALARAPQAAVAPERAAVTASDLAANGSRTVTGAQNAITATGVTTGLGVAGVIAQAVNDTAQPVTQVVNAVQPAVGTFQRIMGLVGDLWWIVAIPLAGFAIWQLVKVIRARVEDQRTGRHA